METNILRLEPRSFVDLIDVVQGDRRLVVLDDAGIGYFDVLGENESAKPLWASLDPKPVPQIVEMLNALPDQEAAILADAWDAMTQKGLDVLTIARGIRWAIENKSSDPSLIERMGLEATQKVLDSRELVIKSMTQS